MYMHVGDYEVISHQETPECSLRSLKLTKDKGVHLHHHHKRIPRDALHDIRTDGEALVLSISMPPLDASDQHMAMEHREG
jgi:hypothetical protein